MKKTSRIVILNKKQFALELQETDSGILATLSRGDQEYMSLASRIDLAVVDALIGFERNFSEKDS